MESKLLSIIVPVYGVEKYLRVCLDALTSQLNSEMEIIAVDDGSRDSCPEICDSYLKYEGVKVIHKENGGLASAIIRGIKESTGKYIGFCDGDDFVTENYAQEVLEAIKKCSPDVIYFEYYRLENGKRDKKAWGSVDNLKVYSEGEDCRRIRELYMKRGGLSPCRWNKVFKREFVEPTLEFYHPQAKIGEDIIFTAPIIYEMKSFYYIKRPLINYNVNEGSMTVNFGTHYIDNYYLVFDCLSRFFGNGSSFLGHIHYINMRTLVNCVSSSPLKNKIKYLKGVLSDKRFGERLASVNEKALSLPDKTILFCMKRRWALPLLLIADAYRGLKWLLS